MAFKRRRVLLAHHNSAKHRAKAAEMGIKEEARETSDATFVV